MANYGSTVLGDAYFATRLHDEAWDGATEDQRNRALAEASRRIDRLNFRGAKTSESQALEWPRVDPKEEFDDDEIPESILIATYEVAYALLDGVDPDQEYENLASSSEGYSSVRTTYNRTTVPEHYAAGIPSRLAWQFLKPLLGNVTGVRLRRVS
jgi:hypothetical protein